MPEKKNKISRKSKNSVFVTFIPTKEIHFDQLDELDINLAIKSKLLITMTGSPTSGRVVALKTGRREVPGSNSGRGCRPSRSEFSRFSRKLE